MRILTVGSLYPPHHFGGYELVWQAAVNALRAAGHEVRVLCVADRLAAVDASDEPGVHRELAWYCRHQHEFPRLRWRARLALERHNHAVLTRHLDELRPQVVSWWSMGGMSLSLIERVSRLGLPSLAWVNNDWLIYGPRVDQWLRLWRVARPLADRAEARTQIPTRLDLGAPLRWIFCSEAMRRESLVWRRELSDTAVLHQGAAAEFTERPAEPWRGRLLYAGRLDERKGVGTLLEAVAGLPEVTLRIVGDGESPAASAALRARAHEIGDRVQFEPSVPRAVLAERYAAADAVVFPVEWLEPWGLVPLESMAVGRPVIATGRGGSGEYLWDEHNALLFPAGDVQGLRAAIRRLAGDPALRLTLRDGGLRTARRLTEASWAAAAVAEHERAAV